MGAPGPGGRWADLQPRIVSGGLMVLVGSAAVLLGGPWFQMLVVFAAAVMIWELWTMIVADAPTRGMLLSALAASVMSGQLSFTSDWGLLLFLVVPLAGTALLARERITFFAFALGIQVAGWGLVWFRAEYGVTWILWMILVVVATDVFGYFAGRLIGGPKFWPRVSPKKTWAGTVAGWLAAAVVGALFGRIAAVPMAQIILVSMALSLASQMGDIAESALKRRMGVKDSSNLIPGHGGLFDRFDALLGASLFLLALYLLTGRPGAAF
ncbi:MAG: phosphatidate cytidylyltransferase [Rubellimicrobium sp.]|nr:phosphatidate cytidylyltransferase [Rubellimicrobium sp.]